MPERPRPNLDAVRETMRERDEDMPPEDTEEEPPQEDEEPEEDQ